MIVNEKVIACYIRLSEDDEDTAKGLKDESNSVTAQRNLIRGYIFRDAELKGYPVREYVDDGYTGTTFTRPGYEKLMDDAKRGEVSIIIVKDLSRLGRDHLETGNLLERIFPLLGIRFISVNDNYDSADCTGMTGGLTVALKNVMNAMYSRDLSGKVRSAMTTRAKSGQYMAAKVPYGYRKDPEDVHHLLVDDEAAEVVRMIFDFAADGKNKHWICGYLNANGIPTPSEYLIAKGGKPSVHRNSKNPRWTLTTIGDMLKNQVYIGNTCWNKSVQNISTGKKNVKNSRDEWIVIENTHEAVVSREIFDRANELAFTGQHKASTGKACPLIYCGYCGRSMAAPKDGNHIRYRCMNGYGEFAEEDCKKSRIKARDLEQTVLANVNLMAQIYAEKKQQCRAPVSEVADVSDRIQSIKKEQERLKARKTRLYEEYRSDGNREVYIKRKQQNDMRLAEIEEELQEAECLLEAAKQNETEGTMTEQALNEVQMMDTFDREKLKKLIDRVNVYAEDEIEIIWKPMDSIFNSISAKEG
mgnify:FL=1